MPHYSHFQRRDDFGQWSGGFVEDYEPQAFADGGRVEEPKEKKSRGLGEIPRHLGAAAGMADYALGGLPSTAVGVIHGLVPGGPRYGDVKAASEAALEDFQELYPNVADPMLEMLDNPMGAGFFGLPAFLRRASRGASVADRLAKAKADLDAANAELKRLGEKPMVPFQPRGGWPSPEAELKAVETRMGLARNALEQARNAGMQRFRDMAEGRIPRALPAPGPNDIPNRIRGRKYELQPDDFIPQKIRTLRGARPATFVRAENDPGIGPIIERQRQTRARDEFRRNLAVQDELAGGPAQRALMRQDDNVDEFVSNLLGRYRRKVLPDLPENRVAPPMREVERFIVNQALDPLSKGTALGEQIPMQEIVNSMVRKGYALPGMRMSVLQGRDRGRFKPFTPAEREFKDAVQNSSAIDRVLRRIWRLNDQ